MKGDLVLVWSYGEKRDCCAIYVGDAEPSPERMPRYWVYSPELAVRDKALPCPTLAKVRQIKRVVQAIQECV